MATELFSTRNLTLNDTSLFDIVNTVNVWSGGFLGVIILVLAFLISYTWLSHYNRPETAFYTSTILVFTFATMLRLMGWINNQIGYICLALVAVGAIMYYIKTE